jgi:RNA polymerase sigma-70 factor (ECF subfamily)
VWYYSVEIGMHFSVDNPQCNVLTDAPMNSTDQQEMFINYQSRHQRMIFAFILTLMPNWNDAEEILQETSLVLWRKFGEFRPGTSYMAWATQVARYEVLKYRARERKGVQLLSDDVLELLADQGSQMSDLLERQGESLQLCLEKLRSQDRTLIKKRYFRGASAGTLATELGRSVESICNSLRRIRGDLLRCVQRGV